jgi:uncharacterized protein YydD (DUF2326 family)
MIRNKVQREVKSARSNYFSDKIEENKNDPKKLWKQLKDLGFKSKTEEASIFLNRGLTLAYFMLWGTTPVVID